MIKKIVELKPELKIEKEFDMTLLLLDSLVYDSEFPISVKENPEKRIEFIQRNKIIEILSPETEKLKELSKKESLNPYGGHMDNVNLEIVVFISLLTGMYWNNIYGLSAKEINIKIDPQNLTDEQVLKTIAKLFWEILSKKPFLRFNFTRGLILINILLNKMGYPSFYMSSRDKKRILKAADYYIDFEKEFLISLLALMNKNIYENKFPGEIISAKEKREKENKKSIYLKPGYWWRGEDRSIYTINN